MGGFECWIYQPSHRAHRLGKSYGQRLNRIDEAWIDIVIPALC